MAKTETAGPEQVSSAWKKQMEDGARSWARMVGQMGQTGQSAPADPLKLWRPFMEQATKDWAQAVHKGAVSGDPMAQWKGFLEQWLSAWDKALSQAMQTEAFAEAIGKHLDQWLSAQAPMRKAATESMETTLSALGVPSRAQVVGITRQLMELDDRLEEIENRLAALNAHLEQKPGRAEKGRRSTARQPKAGRQ